MQITPTIEKYILHWGEMGTKWGVNRTVSQIHALLYLSPSPLRADEIVDLLSVARSNVSNSLKELQTWNLVSVVHQLGDRRDYFTAELDNWEMLMRITEERKKRELDPTIAMLRECVKELETDNQTPDEVKLRIQGMLTFIDTLTGWYDQVKNIPRTKLVKLMKMGSRVAKLIPG